MKIAIVGSGNVGKTYGTLLAQAGHDVIFSWSREKSSLERAVKEAGHGARAAEPVAAVSEAELVLFAPRWEHVEAAARAAGSWTGKLVIDTTNPYKPQRDGIVNLGAKNASQVVVARLPGARYVKALNTLTTEFVARSAGRRDTERVVLFLSGDDAEAKKAVARLIEAIGFVPFDLGSIAESAQQQPEGVYYGEEFRLRHGRPVRQVADAVPAPRSASGTASIEKPKGSAVKTDLHDL